MFVNLGRVYLLDGQAAEAHDAFQQGLRIDPEHEVLLRELVRAERRLGARRGTRSNGVFARLFGRRPAPGLNA